MKRIILHFTVLYLMFGCTNPGDQEQTIPNYKLNMPEKFNMPESLLEISGITFHEGKNDTIYAVQDEQGRVFRLAWNDRKQVNAKFGKQSDYEDLAITRDHVIILKSNGTLFSFPFADAVYEELDSVKEWKGLLSKAEYEGMGVDPANEQLYVICKNCPGDNSKNTVTGYVFQTGDSLYKLRDFSVNVKDIKSITGKVKRGFRPSGLAMNPVTSEWFIISAVNKLLVIADSNWKIKNACQLNGNVFNQPEGIAFDKEGNLYISNEGDDLSEGNILKFVRSR